MRNVGRAATWGLRGEKYLPIVTIVTHVVKTKPWSYFNTSLLTFLNALLSHLILFISQIIITQLYFI